MTYGTMYTTIHLAIGMAIAAPAAAQSARVDTAATKAALLAADSELARAAESSTGARAFVDAFIDAIDADAAILIPGQPILRGGAEARPHLMNRYDIPSSYSWRPAHAVASVDGRFGCTIGLSRFTNASDTTGRLRRGIYMTCWRRAADGRWRIVAHQRNDTPYGDHELPADDVLPGAPHSATVARGTDPRAETHETELAFAKMATEPAGPMPAFAKFAATDAILLMPGFPRGPQAVSSMFDGFAPARVLLWGPARTYGAGSGGLAYTVGQSVNKPADGKSGRVANGHFMTIWRQEPDGRWAYIFDQGSPRP